MKRPSGRAADQLRSIRITRNYTKHAEGSVLVEFGDTKVICTVSVESITAKKNLRAQEIAMENRIPIILFSG